MSIIEKTSTEIKWEFLDSEIQLTTGLIALRIRMSNPYYMQASLGVAKWISPATGEYLPITWAASQIEDPDSIKLLGAIRTVTLLWDAAADLRIMQAWPSITLALSFWDRPGQTGIQTAVQEFSVPVDFTLSALERYIGLIRPVSHDPYFQFDFVTPLTIRAARLHFRLEIDRVESFDSLDCQVYDTALDRTGWTADGEVFPESGLDALIKHRVALSHPSLESVGLGNWVYRISPVVSQFESNISSPVEGQVFLDTTIDVAGTITYWD